MLGIPQCAGCAERQRKMKEAFDTVVGWIKNPTRGGRPPFELLGGATQQAPQNTKKESNSLTTES